MARQVEQVIWSRKSYPLTEFVELYSDNLSQLIIVQQGYLGDAEVETFSKDQIMKIHGLSSQDRVVATDSRNNVLSIPVNYPIEFEVVGTASKPTKLFEILKTRDLPINVQFALEKNRKFYIGNSVKETQVFGTLKLKRIYKEKYLMGNYINEGILDGRVVIVPMYVDIKVGVAMGFGESLKAKWQTFMSVLNSAVSEFDFQHVSGYKEITLYNDGNAGSCADYGIVKPQQIVRMNVVDDRPGGDKETYRKIDLEERLPAEPPPTRPERKKHVAPFSEVRNIVWAKKNYEFKDFYEKFCEDLPQLIIATTGYYGQTELDTIGQDQVIRIQTYSRQKRVVARNSNDHYLSIPIGFHVKMRTFDARGKLSPRPRTLQQIIEESPLPVKACFIQSQNGFAYSSRKNSETYNMGILELEDTYNETYFLGNGLYQGDLDPRVMIVPVYLDISVAIAECFKPDIERDWDQFMTSLATAASNVDYNIPAPNQSIAMYSPDQIRVGDGIYEYLSPSNYVSYMGGNEPDDGLYAEPEEWSESVPNSGTRDNQYYTAIPGDEAHNYIRPTEIASDNNLKMKRSFSVPGGVRVLPVPMKSQNAPPRPLRPKPVTMKKQTSLDETVRTHRNSTLHYEKIGQVTVLPFRHNSFKQAVDQGRQPGIKDKDQIASPRAVNNRYFQSISQTTPTVSQMTARKARKFSDISEVPDDISELSVEEVCECLKLLNLQKHEKAFKALQIDGSLLKNLDAKMFQEDDHFNMSVVETLKLEKFMKGWRPR